jgi:hypothetical protein
MRYNFAFECHGPILAGANNGKSAFASLIKYTAVELQAPTPLFLDFKDVEVATASFLRESVFSFKFYLRSVGSNFYPVAANPNEAVLDDLLMVANSRNDAIVTCVLGGQDEVSHVDLIGQLDPKQQQTFDIVGKLKTADANSLMAKYGAAEQTKGTTAWNNRLASLASKGIILEFSRGRAKYYQPLLEGSA